MKDSNNDAAQFLLSLSQQMDLQHHEFFKGKSEEYRRGFVDGQKFGWREFDQERNSLIKIAKNLNRKLLRTRKWLLLADVMLIAFIALTIIKVII